MVHLKGAGHDINEITYDTVGGGYENPNWRLEEALDAIDRHLISPDKGIAVIELTGASNSQQDAILEFVANHPNGDSAIWIGAD